MDRSALRNQSQKVLDEELNELKRLIAEQHQSAGQVASGKTLASLKVETSDKNGVLYGRTYFGTLETGRKAGKGPSNFTSIIRQWMDDKGITAKPIPYVRVPSERWKPKYTPQERGTQSLSGAIAWKIQKEGTKLFREGGRTDIYSNVIPGTIKNIQDRIMGLFVTEVESININI